MKKLGTAFLLLTLTACGGGTAPGDGVDVPGDATSDPGGPDFAILDIAGGDASPDLGGDDAAPDAAPDLDGPACAPGEGCFLDPCGENADCQSGWCVEHMGDGVCTSACTEECPDGWTCKAVAGTDPDLVYVCVSDHANLCKPCATAGDCVSPAGADDACVDYGDEGAFCGGPCDPIKQPCPWGFTCTDGETVDGLAVTSCLADAGVCPCTDKSVALALWTPCAAESEHGICVGKRVCTEEGLTDCDAALPTEELCNGLDDDCDEEIDEPALSEGDYIPLCEDDNPCTDDACLGAPGCDHVALDAGECVDGDACTVGDHCEAGLCVGLPVVCDDDDPCTLDLCDGQGGCTTEPAEGPCDDGDLCTAGDHCDAGACVSGAPLPCDDGDLCTDDSCDPASGCVFMPNTAPCDDGNPCTTGDQCQGGWCGNAGLMDCDDQDPCTDDTCASETGCIHTLNSAPCDDNDLCTTGDHCHLGTCIPAAALPCNDGNPCTDDSCEALTGCQFTNNAAPCDDGNACTDGDQCAGSACQGGPALVCDDASPCTDDSCATATGCVFGPVLDGTTCPGGTCQAGVCQPSVSGKIVFVGSQKHTGNFGGIPGADSYCQNLASAAGLSGTFRAWLSAGTYASSPASRFNKSTIPYVLVDGTVIANNWADLTDGSIQHPINVNENGGPANTSMVYSFTRVDGSQGLFGSASEDCYGGDCHCNGWTITATGGSPTPGSAVGQTTKSNDDWTDYSFGNFCGGSYPLYCFQQ